MSMIGLLARRGLETFAPQMRRAPPEAAPDDLERAVAHQPLPPAHAAPAEGVPCANALESAVHQSKP